jgi:hypothetical protein
MRALIQLPFAKLEEMFNTNPSDLEVLISLQQELVHRKKAYAKQLLIKVNAKLVAVQLKPAAQSQKAAGDTASSATSTTESNQVLKVPARSKSPETTRKQLSLTSTETAYEHLRATFSEEGELMARWGMTPSLPRPLQETVVGGWRDLLRDSPTTDGRTLVNFERDIARILEISAKEK